MIRDVLKNKEGKNILLKFAIIQLFIIFLLFAFSSLNKKLILEDIINSKIEIATIILENNPELEDDISKIIIGKAEKEKFNNTKEILKKQGYDKDININLDNTLKTVDIRNNIFFIVVTAISILIGIVILTYELNKIYIKVRDANKYIDNVLKGKIESDLDYEGEGDFPILANELNKMVSVIVKDNEIIKREKNNMKEFLTEISHQLKTPLTSITIITDLLKIKENISTEKKLEFLQNIEVQSDRMNWLIYNLLKIARLDAGVIELQNDNVAVDKVLNSALDTLKVLINEKEIEINCDYNNCYFKGDEKWTIEAISNIIKNSIEHSYKNGKIDIKTEETLVYTKIFIKDYGKGIGKKDLPNIFKRFYSKNSSSGKNIGVGLSMAKSIIEKQNGYITIKSEEGSFTKFEITFIK